MFYSRMLRNVMVLIIVLVFASTAYALAASNTLADAGKAGDGSNSVSGYTVSNVKYTLDTKNPSLIASVEFDLDAAASSVAASLINTATSTETFASACGNGGSGNHWTCTFGTVSALSADSFRVISAQ